MENIIIEENYDSIINDNYYDISIKNRIVQSGRFLLGFI
jgi:hypothetical protein